MLALLLVPAALVLIFVVALSLCSAAARGDEIARRALARRHEGDQP